MPPENPENPLTPPTSTPPKDDLAVRQTAKLAGACCKRLLVPGVDAQKRRLENFGVRVEATFVGLGVDQADKTDGLDNPDAAYRHRAHCARLTSEGTLAATGRDPGELVANLAAQVGSFLAGPGLQARRAGNLRYHTRDRRWPAATRDQLPSRATYHVPRWPPVPRAKKARVRAPGAPTAPQVGLTQPLAAREVVAVARGLSEA